MTFDEWYRNENSVVVTKHSKRYYSLNIRKYTFKYNNQTILKGKYWLESGELEIIVSQMSLESTIKTKDFSLLISFRR